MAQFGMAGRKFQSETFVDNAENFYNHTPTVKGKEFIGVRGNIHVNIMVQDVSMGNAMVL